MHNFVVSLDGHSARPGMKGTGVRSHRLQPGRCVLTQPKAARFNTSRSCSPFWREGIAAIRISLRRQGDETESHSQRPGNPGDVGLNILSTRTIVALVAMTVLMLTYRSAAPQSQPSYWLHNGSVVQLRSDGE